MLVHVGCDIAATPGCCGVRQITQFSNTSPRKDDFRYLTLKASGDTEDIAYANLLRKIQEYLVDNGGEDRLCAVAQIWFVKEADFEGNFEDDQIYKAEPLRLLVEALPDVIELGEHHNPNSGNYIKGYQWSVL